MKLPIEFPQEADVAREQALRFRTLAPDDQRHAIDEMYGMYHFLLGQHDYPERATVKADAEEACGRAAIEEFVLRHGQ